MAKIFDIVLIYSEEKPLSFARIEEITPDIKKDWFNVKLLILQIPLHTAIWTLRGSYIDGAEFSMNGKKMRLEKVTEPEKNIAHGTAENSPKKNTSKKGSVISIFDHMAGKHSQT